MKTMKKFAALLLVVVLMAAMLVVPANAAGVGGKLIINDSIKDVTYNVYKMFDLTTDGANAYTYTINSDWAAFFAGDGAQYIEKNGDYVTIKDGKNAALADAAAEYVKTATPSISAVVSGTGNDGVLTLAVTSNGYYVVSTSLANQHGFGASLANGKEVTVDEKNALPTIDKTSTGTAGVGDVVDYTIVINVEGKVDAHYVVNDNMAGGKLSLVAGSVNVTGIDSGKMTYAINSDGSVTFTLDKDALDALEAGAPVTITYKATVVSAGEIKNKVILNQTIGGPDDDDSEATSYNYNIDITKRANNAETGTLLAGAQFVLTNAAGQYAKHADGKFAGWMAKTDAETATGYADAVIWTSGDNGKIAINGVPAGTYTLKEIAAPEGYKLPTDTTTIIIVDDKNNETDAAKADGKIDGDTDDTMDVTVVNYSGTQLPSTGGVGTTMFYLFGAMMVLAAVVVLVTRRRVTQ